MFGTRPRGRQIQRSQRGRVSRRRDAGWRDGVAFRLRTTGPAPLRSVEPRRVRVRWDDDVSVALRGIARSGDSGPRWLSSTPGSYQPSGRLGAVVGHVARPTAAGLRRKCPPKSVWGTIGVSRRPVRSDSRSIAASRFFHRRHRPDAWSAVASKSASDRVRIAFTAGRARECARRSRSTAHAVRRQAPAGRANEHAAPRGLNSPPARSRHRNR